MPREEGHGQFNPYAAPQADIRHAAQSEDVGAGSHGRLRREAIVRLAGLLGLIAAVVLFLAFSLGTLSELQHAVDDVGWRFERWVVRMASVLALAALAIAIDWGLLGLRNWARLALTVVTLLPVPALALAWLLLGLTRHPRLAESVSAFGLTVVSVMSGLSCSVLLSVMWSPKGRTVFSPDYAETLDRKVRLGPGCLGVGSAFVFLLAEFGSFVVLLMTVLTLAAVSGTIRSV
jgi:hypothetical protein